MVKKMSKREEVARLLCEWRGVPPDEPVLIGKPPRVEITDEGTEHERRHEISVEPEHHPVAWKGYAEIADKIIKAVKRG